MKLSITTDYARANGDPEPYLRRIADSGFSHVHWCHHWHGDFLYSKWEIEHLKKCLKSYGLELLDLHASQGNEKNWTSYREHERLAGIELVNNRIEMTAQLGGKVMIIHIPPESGSIPLRKSLDQLELFARARGVRIAIENGKFEVIQSLLQEYDPDYLGLCYDSGHGNQGDGLDRLEVIKDRLISVHLHDNDGVEDLHQIPFTNTVDWSRLAQIIAKSSYKQPVSLESVIHNSGVESEEDFLKQVFEAGVRLSHMIDEARKSERA